MYKASGSSLSLLAFGDPGDAAVKEEDSMMAPPCEVTMMQEK
jgi:hypothetical protein